MMTGQTALSQSDSVNYDELLRETMLGTWYRIIAVYSDSTIDSTYKKYDIYPDGRLEMTEVRNGVVEFSDYCSYFITDSVFFLVTHFKDSSFITDAVIIEDLDSTNFRVNSIFKRSPHYKKTTYGQREKIRELPKDLPPKKDEELEMPGFALRITLVVG